jgi:hypothetical protein
MGGQHSEKVAVRKVKPKVKAKVAEPVNPLAGERRRRIKTKMKFKRWV